MTPSKGTLIGFAASLFVHAAVVAPFSVYWPKARRAENEAVMISYVIYPKTTASIQPKPVSKPPISAPTKRIAVAAPKVRQIQYPPPVKKPVKPEPAVRNSEELSVDPQNGKIFLGYFEKIKRRIHETVQKKYAHENPGQGIVSLIFILRADGGLENVAIVPRESNASPVVQNFVVQCIKESPPFAPFPTELGLQKISFSVTVIFDTVQ